MKAFVDQDLRALGRSGIRLSPLGLGTVKIGRNTGVKYPEGFALPTDDEVRALLATARDCGINFLDTAPAYGTAEARLGALLGSRHDWIISTKVGETFDGTTSRFDFSRTATEASVHRSLDLLRTDYLDIVLVHSDGNDEHIMLETDVLDVLSRLRAAGKIRAFGVSTKTVNGGLMAARLSDVVMIALNPIEVTQRPVLEAAAQYDCGVLVKKGLASGHATDPGAALRFCLDHAAVTSVVVGTIDPRHLRHNVEAVL